MSKKFVYLSAKSRERVTAWRDANVNHPLADAWDGACIACGGNLYEAVEYWKLRDLAFQFRDTAGREILKLIKEGKA